MTKPTTDPRKYWIIYSKYLDSYWVLDKKQEAIPEGCTQTQVIEYSALASKDAEIARLQGKLDKYEKSSLAYYMLPHRSRLGKTTRLIADMVLQLAPKSEIKVTCPEVEALEKKLAIAEKKLEKCTKQRNKTIVNHWVSIDKANYEISLNDQELTALESEG